MFRNVYYDTKQSKIHLWEQINGENFYDCIEWTPYCYMPDDAGDVKAIDGTPCTVKYFKNYSEYNWFQRESHEQYENKVPPTIQFLAERYHEIPDEDIILPKINIHYEDIEVHSERGFPNAHQAEWPITLISVCHKDGVHVFGSQPYEDREWEEKYNVTYVECINERELLRAYFNWKHTNPCDVVTGWNYCNDSKMNKYGGFDLPYIINRTKNLFGRDTSMYKKLSPINIVKVRNHKETNTYTIDIAGVSVLDYLSLYKWYSPKNLESFKLDYVVESELGENKLEMGDYKSLQRLYKENYQQYVNYNIKDSVLIKGLEDKLGYIKLCQALILLTKSSMRNYSGATHLIEGLMLTYYRRNGLCAPKLIGGTQEWFPAAYVKEPKRGLHEWVVDLDIASSYPTAIITLNMSLETFFGRICGFNREQLKNYKRDGRTPFKYTDVTKHTKVRKFPPFWIHKENGFDYYDGPKLEKFNKAIERRLLSIAPCGSMFVNKPVGVLASVEKAVYMKRKSEKGKMIQLRKQAAKLPDGSEKDHLEELANQKFALQWALKIMINAMFGITGVPYSRYFLTDMSEAVTSCGKTTILNGQQYVNELMNNPSQELLDIVKEIGERI